MSGSVPARRPSWAWNYRWTITDAERAMAMAMRGEHPSAIARVFSTTVGEIAALLRRNDVPVGGGSMTWADAA